MGKTLFQKVWDAHEVRKIDRDRSQLFIGLHLIHEVTSPQAFGMLRDEGIKVKYPHLTFATVDHIVSTTDRSRPAADQKAEEMFVHLKKNTQEHGIQYFEVGSGKQGIVHVIGPELGLTQPGRTIVCGDSHTATHGAFGAVAFGIGTSQVRDVLATQTLAMEPLKVRQIRFEGQLGQGVSAKDLVLHMLGKLGVHGGQGFAYEYCGPVIDAMSMEQRMTLCNMSIEGGARCGYINPDQTTFDWLKGREFVPKNKDWKQLTEEWSRWKSDEDATYDDSVTIDCTEITPTMTWGIHPGQVISIDENIPKEASGQEALEYMQLEAGSDPKNVPVNVAFIGSCTNGRLEDFQTVADKIKGKRVAPGVRAIAVPGSEWVDKKARERNLHKVFEESGFEWRKPGCSMCLAMNPDKLNGDELCVSTSNRNFKGRQGSKTGRTVLMSPLSVAASAVSGKIADPRKVFELE